MNVLIAFLFGLGLGMGMPTILTVDPDRASGKDVVLLDLGGILMLAALILLFAYSSAFGAR